MKKAAVWMLAGWCVALVVPNHAIAQTPDFYNPSSGIPDYEGPANRMMDNYIQNRQFDMIRKASGSRYRDTETIQRSPRNSTGRSSTRESRSGSIVPRMMAANAPEAQRGKLEKMYSTLLKLYPVSAKRFGIRANNDRANIAAVFVCSNMQVISQRQVSPAECTAVSRQMKRVFSNSNPKYAKLDPKTKRFGSDYMAIVATSMIVVFDGMQDKPNPQMQANASAQASAELQKMLGVPGNQLQITSRGLSKK
jgi:hypothetical protein